MKNGIYDDDGGGDDDSDNEDDTTTMMIMINATHPESLEHFNFNLVFKEHVFLRLLGKFNSCK